MRRFGPLYVVFGLALLALVARLWDVQVTQHDLWAAESVNLVRSHSVEPYVRGAIRDRNGRLLAHDEEVYALDFIWREFRRGHPLGQVAMMRSLAKTIPAGLHETSPILVESALAFASLSPADLEVFAEGGALELPGVDYVPAIAADDEAERRQLARARRRPARAGDLRFYLSRLLDLSSREQKALRELIDTEGARGRSYLDLVGEVTQRETEEVASNLRRRVRDAQMRLLKLARLLEFDEDEAGVTFDPTQSPGDRLVAIIEDRRREVEDDAADALFRIAAGFSARRLSEENLERFNLDWLSAALDWDETRLAEWRASRAALFGAESLAWIADHTIARAKLGQKEPADRVLSSLAHAFRADADRWSRGSAEPQDWRQIDELAVLAALPEHVVDGDELTLLCTEPLFDLQRSEVQQTPEVGEELIAAVLRRELGGAFVEVAPEERGDGGPAERRVTPEQLLRFARTARRDWDPKDRDAVAAVLVQMHVALQRRIARVLDAAAGEDGRITLAPVHVEKAQETRRYVVRDRGARSRTIGKEPSMDVVLLVTRYPEAFAGFHATRRSERVLARKGPDARTPLAAKLIGTVRNPYLVEVLRQRPRMEELSGLRRKLRLPEEDTGRILDLIDASYQPGESIGGSGLEAWFDEELTGRSGVLEVQGLQDRVDGNRAPIYRGARDGEDVHLTLDAGLQFAAEEVLMNPEYPADDPRADRVWFERPIGAIVLATVDGEILAAASWPAEPDLRQDTDAMTLDGERMVVRERTLGRATERSPGSVVKPMMAAYALEYLSLDPVGRTYVCNANKPREGTSPKALKNPRAGWGAVDCNSRWGHSHVHGRPMAMHDALCFSCNVYFAGLAEELYDEMSILDVYRVFGFDRPTGVRWDDDGRRGGLRDAYGAGDPVFERDATAIADAKTRQFLGNGLAHVHTNVVQVARAYAGLATGHLPEMSLVSKVAGEEVPRRVTALPISERNLELVRRSLRAVVTQAGGSANGKGLAEGDLKFTLAAKTGSADRGIGMVPTNDRTTYPSGWRPGMRKHTWVAGWFPAEEPEYVLTVMCHDTSSTSSHSAIYIARQFLMRPEIAELMGVER